MLTQAALCREEQAEAEGGCPVTRHTGWVCLSPSAWRGQDAAAWNVAMLLEDIRGAAEPFPPRWFLDAWRLHLFVWPHGSGWQPPRAPTRGMAHVKSPRPLHRQQEVWASRLPNERWLISTILS